MKIRTLIAAVLLLGVAGESAQAAQATANLTVTATVSDACGVADAALAFGVVAPTTGTVTPITGAINVTCTLGTAFTVGLGNGLNASSGARRMRKGATTDYLTYEIYRDLLGLSRFGDTGSSDRAAGLGVGLLATPVAFYGQVPSGQSTATGAYSDTVQIVLYY